MLLKLWKKSNKNLFFLSLNRTFDDVEGTLVWKKSNKNLFFLSLNRTFAPLLC